MKGKMRRGKEEVSRLRQGRSEWKGKGELERRRGRKGPLSSRARNLTHL